MRFYSQHQLVNIAMVLDFGLENVVMEALNGSFVIPQMEAEKSLGLADTQIFLFKSLG